MLLVVVKLVTSSSGFLFRPTMPVPSAEEAGGEVLWRLHSGVEIRVHRERNRKQKKAEEEFTSPEAQNAPTIFNHLPAYPSSAPSNFSAYDASSGSKKHVWVVCHVQARRGARVSGNVGINVFSLWVILGHDLFGLF